MAPEPAPNDTIRAGAILLAVGGAGSPDGDVFDPIWAPLGGKPLLAWSVAALERAPEIADVTLVVAPDRLPDVAALADAQDWQHIRIFAPTETDLPLSDLLRTALYILMPDLAWIVIHDAARPLVTPEMIAAALAAVSFSVGAQQAAPAGTPLPAGRGAGGEVPAAPAVAAAASIPVTETLKRVQNGLVVETPARSQLALLQTPQVFSRSALLAALDTAPYDLDLPYAASLAVAAGLRVALFPGSPANIRVATPTDLALAEALLNPR